MFPKKKTCGAANRNRKREREENTAKLVKITDILPPKRIKVCENEESNNTAIKTKPTKVSSVEDKQIFTSNDSENIFQKVKQMNQFIQYIRMILSDLNV